MKKKIGTVLFRLCCHTSVIYLIILSGAFSLFVGLIDFFVSYLFDLPASSVFNYFILEGTFSQMLIQPWAIITYVLAYDNFWSWFISSFILFQISTLSNSMLSAKRQIFIMLSAQLICALLFLTINQFVFPIQGASLNGTLIYSLALFSSIMVQEPNYQVRYLYVFSSPLWAIGAIFIFSSIVYLFAYGDVSSGLAVSMSVSVGALIGNYFREINSVYQSSDIFESLKSYYTSPKPSLTYVLNQREEYLNQILDKISLVGYNRLSKEEKDFLSSLSTYKNPSLSSER